MAADNRKAVAALIAGMVAVAAPMAARWEGFAPKVYKDPLGIPTYCYGETENVSKDPARIYAKTECMALLRARMARDYAPQIVACLPQLQTMDRRQATIIGGALLDAAYNAGPAAVCRSQMAINLRAGYLKSTCTRFVGWYETGRDRRTGKRVWLRGLANRRLYERDKCLEALK